MQKDEEFKADKEGKDFDHFQLELQMFQFWMSKHRKQSNLLKKMILAKQTIIKVEPEEIVNNENRLITLQDFDSTSEIDLFKKYIIFSFIYESI